MLSNIISRRDFVKFTGGAAAALAFGPRFLLRAASAAEKGKRRPILVHVFQRGGMDALSAVAPYAEKEYWELRKSLAVPAPGKADRAGIDLDGHFALHPSLGALRDDFAAKRLAIVHAVGSPDPTRSHFDAQDYMETGTPGRKGTPDGWLSRYVTENAGAGDTTFRSLAITSTLPRTMKGDAQALAISNFGSFTVGGGDKVGDAFGKMYARGESDVVRNAGTEAFEAVRKLRELNPSRFRPENGAQYPRGRFGQEMLSVAQMIKAEVGMEVAFLESGGWDTHLNQGGATGNIANRLQDLGDAIHAFGVDMGDRMKDIVVVTLTEFGRTAKENGTVGTDHGHGSASFVMGGEVRGGKIYGKWPGLKKENLYQGRDLAVTTDFRDILSEILVAHMGAKKVGGIFPDYRPKKLRLIG